MKNNLKEYRMHFLWKQSDFAANIGVSKSHMCQLESGTRLPSLEVAYKIAVEFGVDVEYIWPIDVVIK